MATLDEYNYWMARLRESGKEGPELVDWIIDNWETFDFSKAGEYLQQARDATKDADIERMKQGLRDLGETDPYLEKQRG